MAKPKFELTTDLAKIESEPMHPQPLPAEKHRENAAVKKVAEEKNINLNASKALKKELQVWCIHHDKRMTEAIEEAIRGYLGSKP